MLKVEDDMKNVVCDSVVVVLQIPFTLLHALLTPAVKQEHSGAPLTRSLMFRLCGGQMKDRVFEDKDFDPEWAKIMNKADYKVITHETRMHELLDSLVPTKLVRIAHSPISLASHLCFTHDGMTGGVALLVLVRRR